MNSDLAENQLITFNKIGRLFCTTYMIPCVSHCVTLRTYFWSLWDRIYIYIYIFVF